MTGKTTVIFGGESRELWTDDGLTVACSGGVTLTAERADGGWVASAPPPRGGDVKADMDVHSRAVELACRINSGSVPPLTLAYFRAACLAQEGVDAVVRGGVDSLLLPETLRVLLDERGMCWDDAISEIARRFVYDAAESGTRTPLAAISALGQRTARLIGAVNEKLCARLWDAFPGDWRRIGSAAVICDGEVSFPALSAVLCGRVLCPDWRRGGEFRTLYTLHPERFEEKI